MQRRFERFWREGRLATIPLLLLTQGTRTNSAHKLASMVDHARLYPECRFVFLGDNGCSRGGDIEVAEGLASQLGDFFAGAYIHTVKALARSGPELEQAEQRWSEMRVWHYETCLDGAVAMAQNGHVTEEGLWRIALRADWELSTLRVEPSCLAHYSKQLRHQRAALEEDLLTPLPSMSTISDSLLVMQSTPAQYPICAATLQGMLGTKQYRVWSLTQAGQSPLESAPGDQLVVTAPLLPCHRDATESLPRLRALYQSLDDWSQLSSDHVAVLHTQGGPSLQVALAGFLLVKGVNHAPEDAAHYIAGALHSAPLPLAPSHHRFIRHLALKGDAEEPTNGYRCIGCSLLGPSNALEALAGGVVNISSVGRHMSLPLPEAHAGGQGLVMRWELAPSPHPRLRHDFHIVVLPKQGGEGGLVFSADIGALLQSREAQQPLPSLADDLTVPPAPLPDPETTVKLHIKAADMDISNQEWRQRCADCEVWLTLQAIEGGDFDDLDALSGGVREDMAATAEAKMTSDNAAEAYLE